MIEERISELYDIAHDAEEENREREATIIRAVAIIIEETDNPYMGLMILKQMSATFVGSVHVNQAFNLIKQFSFE